MSSSNNRRRQASNPGDAPPINRARIENIGLNILPAANINNNNNNLTNNDVEAIISAERARALIVDMPPAAMYVPLIDIRNQLTSSNYAFAGWRSNHVFNSLTGMVQFVHRGATLRRSFDRCDVRVSFGFGTDTQTAGIYAYDQAAAILESAVVGQVCTFTTLTVVEQGTDRARWTGTLPFVRFTRVSAIGTSNNVNTNNLEINENNNIGAMAVQREIPGTSSIVFKLNDVFFMFDFKK